MPPILEAHGLTKRFKTTEALAGLDLVAERGQVTAILGPNGAGKTTFIRMVATLLLPDAGSLTVAGIDAIREPEKVRRAIGLAGQSAAVESAMTGRENLELVGRLFGHDARQAKASAGVVLDLLGLGDAADRLARTYSGGMRRKLDLGASLVGAPELLLLDEPTTGLDPRSRNDLWDAIRDLVAAGTDVLLTTQYLDEADHLANRIAIIDHGKVIAEGTPDELKSMAGDDVIQVHVAHLADVDRAIEVLAPMGTGEPRVDRPTRSVAVPVDKGSARLLEAVRAMDALGLEVSDIGLRRATLDEVFLSLTGRHGGSRPPTTNPTPAAAAGAARPSPHPRRACDDRRQPHPPPRSTFPGPRGTAGVLTTTVGIARRTVLHNVRNPQVFVLGMVQGAMFLLIFRYVFGGAITTNGVRYVDFLVPGFVGTGVLFAGMTASIGAAEDLHEGLFDRLRSLPVPRMAIVGGRVVADTILATIG